MSRLALFKKTPLKGCLILNVGDFINAWTKRIYPLKLNSSN